MNVFASIVSFFQCLIVKAAAKALPRLLSNRWLDCLHTNLEWTGLDRPDPQEVRRLLRHSRIPPQWATLGGK
jgi:hypothetical protein